MLTRILFPFWLAVAALLPLHALAADNIASVDYQRILKEAPQIKASEDLLKQEYAPQKKALEKLQKKTMELLKVYRNTGPGTNPLEQASAAENFKNSRDKLQKMSKQYNAGLQLREAQLQASFKKTLGEEVSLYAQLHGLTIVVKEGTLYASSATDITDKILALLKRDYQKAQTSAGKKAK